MNDSNISQMERVVSLGKDLCYIKNTGLGLEQSMSSNSAIHCVTMTNCGISLNTHFLIS